MDATWCKRVNERHDIIFFSLSLLHTILENESGIVCRSIFGNPGGCNGFVNWRIRNGWVEDHLRCELIFLSFPELCSNFFKKSIE